MYPAEYSTVWSSDMRLRCKGLGQILWYCREAGKGAYYSPNRRTLPASLPGDTRHALQLQAWDIRNP